MKDLAFLTLKEFFEENNRFHTQKGVEALFKYQIFSLRQAQILILEICPYIPAVKIFAFLDLEQNCSFLDGH